MSHNDARDDTHDTHDKHVKRDEHDDDLGRDPTRRADEAEPSTGVGTDGSLHGEHHRSGHSGSGHPGVGTDGSLHSEHEVTDDNRSD